MMAALVHPARVDKYLTGCLGGWRLEPIANYATHWQRVRHKDELDKWVSTWGPPFTTIPTK